MPEFKDNVVVMEPSNPTSATAQAELAGEAQAEAHRTSCAPVLRSKGDQMAFLMSTIQGMEKNIKDILLKQKSLERIGETKFHDLDVKVS
ncbi:hypothetical protein D1007_56391 [Hordeum vulgare]|nr:hypothetical protein D1007_56391 [Hordeum vulgare]